MNKNETLIAVSESGRFWSVAFEELSRPEQVFRSVWDLESDVNNGGFDQYYWNSSGDTAFAAVDALVEISAHATAAIVTRAHEAFPGGAPSKDQSTRQELVEAITAEAEGRWESLDSEFCRYPDDLTELLFRYVKRHASSIEGIGPADLASVDDGDGPTSGPSEG